jgi:predicted dehydrogenase
MKRVIKRRTFLKQAAVAGAGVMVLRSGLLAAGKSPSDKLNIAVVGCGGRGWADLQGVRSENIVALCDVNSKNLAKAAKAFPDAKTHEDWRKCLDQKDIDAVVCASTDHTHAFVNVWALNRGFHVYCEKPLANSVEEARMVRSKYLEKKDKIATQMGTQIHASDNYRRIVELVRGGAVGKITDCHVWCSRMPKGGSYLPEAGPAPDYINWDLWVGPSKMHPYNPGYFPGGCLGWNIFWDFGSGQIGDMGSHMMDMAYWPLGLKDPTSCKAEGSEQSTDTVPTWLKVEWEHPANEWRDAIKVYWYDGGKLPGFPMKIISREEALKGKGMLIRGDKGWLLCDYDYWILRNTGDMTDVKLPKKEDQIPASIGHHKEWITACKTGSPTGCNFDYSGALIEANMLALAAYRVGKPLEWDAKNLKATNCPEVDQYIKKTYREGWVLDG